VSLILLEWYFLIKNFRDSRDPSSDSEAAETSEDEGSATLPTFELPMTPNAHGTQSFHVCSDRKHIASF
jgi:hypothetical protein